MKCKNVICACDGSCKESENEVKITYPCPYCAGANIAASTAFDIASKLEEENEDLKKALKFYRDHFKNHLYGNVAREALGEEKLGI